MKRKRLTKAASRSAPVVADYGGLMGDIAELLAAARRASARAVNALMTATYWEIGRRIVEFEQGGAARAEYGGSLLRQLSRDLRRKFGRGFSPDNLEHMRRFFMAFPESSISETVSRKSQAPTAQATAIRIAQSLSAKSASEICPTSSGNSETSSRKSYARWTIAELARAFPLPWSHYVLLIRHARSPEALEFYHTEALRGGWSVRQL